MFLVFLNVFFFILTNVFPGFHSLSQPRLHRRLYNQLQRARSRAEPVQCIRGEWFPLRRTHCLSAPEIHIPSQLGVLDYVAATFFLYVFYLKGPCYTHFQNFTNSSGATTHNTLYRKLYRSAESSLFSPVFRAFCKNS